MRVIPIHERAPFRSEPAARAALAAGVVRGHLRGRPNLAWLVAFYVGAFDRHVHLGRLRRLVVAVEAFLRACEAGDCCAEHAGALRDAVLTRSTPARGDQVRRNHPGAVARWRRRARAWHRALVEDGLEEGGTEDLLLRDLRTLVLLALADQIPPDAEAGRSRS